MIIVWSMPNKDLSKFIIFFQFLVCRIQQEIPVCPHTSQATKDLLELVKSVHLSQLTLVDFYNLLFKLRFFRRFNQILQKKLDLRGTKIACLEWCACVHWHCSDSCLYLEFPDPLHSLISELYWQLNQNSNYLISFLTTLHSRLSSIINIIIISKTKNFASVVSHWRYIWRF